MWRTLSKLRRSYYAYSRLCKQKASKNKSQLEHINLNENKNRYLHGCSNCGANGSESSNGRRGFHEQRSGEYFQIKHDWLDAIGWSGVALLSWYICHPYKFRTFPFCPSEKFTQPQRPKEVRYCTFVSSISKILWDYSTVTGTHVLPIVNAVRDEPVNSSEFEFEKRLKEGCDSLESAHEAVSSSLLNFLGTECMQNGNHDQAFSNFAKAAQGNNLAALFNLAICYEMGFGTKQSFNKAAELYKKAADLGHATAMYNLGVFHVHGWGGLEADVGEARRLFTAAANLGQADAKAALSIEDSSGESSGSDSDSEDDFDVPLFTGVTSEDPKTTDMTELWLKVLNINLHDTGTKPKNQKFSSVDSGVNDLSPVGDAVFLLPNELRS